MAVLMLTLIGYIIYSSRQGDYYFSQGTALTCATVYRYDSSDANGNCVVRYSYLVDSVRYTGSYTGNSFPGCDHDHHCIGQRVYLRYALKKPEVHQVYIDSPYKGDCTPKPD